MNIEGLKEYIHYNEEYERYVAIPNRLFDKLLSLIKSNKLKSQHVGFAFSFIYLQAYMFRYAKYEKVVPTSKQLKEMLAYSANNKTLDYIIKRNGLLDQSKITYTSNDFVILAKMDKCEVLEFTYVSDLYEHEKFRKARNIGLSQSYKVPIFGLYADSDSYFNDEHNPYDGTFYPFEDGISEHYTLIDFNVFAYMMANKDLGVNAFYLHSYILYKNSILGEGYNATAERLSNETGMSVKTIKRYRDIMRSYNAINLIHEMDYFVLGLKDKYARKASSNFANTYEEFTDEKNTYSKQSMISYAAYRAIKESEQNELNVTIEIDITQLPY